MTPNELRLGNFIRIKDNNTIAKVERLSLKKVGFHYNDDKSRGYFRKYSEIEPILIYDQWRKIERGIVEWDDKSEDETLYFYTPLGYDRTIRYIHELQNLHFALTGEELKIEL